MEDLFHFLSFPRSLHAFDNHSGAPYLRCALRLVLNLGLGSGSPDPLLLGGISLLLGHAFWRLCSSSFTCAGACPPHLLERPPAPCFRPLSSQHPLPGSQGHSEACFSHSGKGNSVLPAEHTPARCCLDTLIRVDCEPSGQGPSTNTSTDSMMPPAGDRAEAPTVRRACLSPPVGHEGLLGSSYHNVNFPVEPSWG